MWKCVLSDGQGLCPSEGLGQVWGDQSKQRNDCMIELFPPAVNAKR